MIIFYYINKIIYLDQSIFDINAYINNIFFEIFYHKLLFGISNNKKLKFKIYFNLI